MTVEAAPLPVAEMGNRPPRAQAKAQKQRTAQARKEILAPVNGALRAASVLVAVAAVCGVVPFVLIVEACRELLADPADSGRVWSLLWAAVIVLLVRGVLQAAALSWSHYVDGGFQLAVRRALADKLGRVPLGWFSERSSGDVKKYLQDDVEALHYLVAHARLDFVGGLVTPLVTLAYLFWVDWGLGLVLLIPLLVYGIALMRMMETTSRDRMAVYNRWERRVQDATIEFVDGIQVVRTFGRARKAHAEFQEAVDGQTSAFTRWKLPLVRLQAISDVAVAPVFVMAVVVVFGLAFVELDWLEPIDLLPFLLVGLGVGSSLLGLGYGGQALRAAGDAAVRLHDLHQTPELRTGAPDPVAAADTDAEAGLVRFAGVGFGYRDDHRVLHEIDLELRPGTLTALVGPSGSGKSTLAKLLPRFYDVGTGRITVGGRDIRDFASDELYRTVGFVFQDVRLIRGSVRENLRLARPDADDEALEAAARAARIHDRILALPRGYDSEIGLDATLSGGEAQRLSIARTLLADTPVLVLDEATAFADPESEAAVQDALAELVTGRTVLVISHRLHTITGADQILVLERGTLVEQGEHDVLKTAGGTYQRLWEINHAAIGALGSAESGEVR